MIMRAMEHSLPWEQVEQLLHELQATMQRFDVRALREILCRAVREYVPSCEVADLVWCHLDSQQQLRSKVVSLDGRHAASASKFAPN